MLRLWMRILWPSFLVAIIAEGLFFSLFDPRDLLQLGGLPGLPPIAGYTIGFFFFWLCCSMAGMLTCSLLDAPDQRRPPG